MKKYLFLLPLAATAGAVWLNLPGFVMGGPREWWELAVTAGYLTAWAVFIWNRPKGWQRWAAVCWWALTCLCAAASFCVVTFHWDGFLLFLPALGLITPLSGLAVLTGLNYPLFHGLCSILAFILAMLPLRCKR